MIKNAIIIVKKGNLFKKILKKCFNILKRKDKFYSSKEGKDKEKNIQRENIKKEDEYKTNFYYNDSDIKKMQLLELQKKFENGEIKEADLSKEQVNVLKKLYNDQIKQLKTSVIRYKRRILKLYEE